MLLPLYTDIVSSVLPFSPSREKSPPNATRQPPPGEKKIPLGHHQEASLYIYKNTLIAVKIAVSACFYAGNRYCNSSNYAALRPAVSRFWRKNRD
jgi:hypothetical protein